VKHFWTLINGRNGLVRRRVVARPLNGSSHNCNATPADRRKFSTENHEFHNVKLAWPSAKGHCGRSGTMMCPTCVSRSSGTMCPTYATYPARRPVTPVILPP